MTWFSRTGCIVLAAVLVVATGGAALGAKGSGTSDPKEKPEAAESGLPKPDVRILSREEKIQRRFQTLVTQYKLRLQSPDWILRSLAVISLSRLPLEEATRAILERLEAEPEPVGKLVAWQVVLSRARLLTDEQFKTWQAQTWKMVEEDLFNGDLRIGLLEMLSAVPITRRSRTYFTDLFKTTNSLDSSDVPTLIAMGRALKSWGDADLVTHLLRALGNPNTGVRAELVLQAAGAGVPWNRTAQARKVYTAWWQENRDAFTANPPAEDGWKRLKAQYCEGPVDPKTIDLADPTWHDELELGRLELQNFDFAIALDCSRSMRPEIERLKHDMAVMVAAFRLVAREPRVGVTLFSPGGIVKCQPLTSSTAALGAFLKREAHIFGPVGAEEWAGALHQSIARSKWVSPGLHSRRFIVLISDEPITRGQFVRAWTIAQGAGRAHFKIYGVMIKAGRSPNNPLSVPLDRDGGAIPPPSSDGGEPKKAGHSPPSRGERSWQYYHDLVDLTGALAIEVKVPQGGWGLGTLPDLRALNKNQRKRLKDFSPVAIAPLYPGGGPTVRVLTMVLRDAINPQYADRVEPFVKILVAYCQGYAKTPPEQRRWGKPDKMEPNRKPKPSKKAKAKKTGKKADEKADEKPRKKRKPETTGNIKPL